MAYTAQSLGSHGIFPALRGGLARAFSAALRMLDSAIEGMSRTRQVQELMALSDAELAARGLTRDRIVHHVFSDRFWV